MITNEAIVLVFHICLTMRKLENQLVFVIFV